jgi:hypothetical protein
MLSEERLAELCKTSSTLRRRTEEALAETRRFLEKEMRYSPDLRKQSHLDYLNGHIAKLERILG